MIKRPSKVKVGGVTYDINTDSDIILQVYDWLINHDLDSIDQGIMIVTLMISEHAPVTQGTIDVCTNALLIDNDNTSVNQKRDMCFLQDYPIYRADIIREYGVDIAETPVPFEKLIMFITNLSPKSRLNEVREIRNTNTSKIKDLEQRAIYKKLQQQYKLKDISITNVEREEMKEDKERINNLARKFM